MPQPDGIIRFAIENSRAASAGDFTQADGAMNRRVRHQFGLFWVLALSGASVLTAAAQVGMGIHDRGLFVLFLTMLVCSAAAWWDAGTARIPNALTYTAILLGLGLNLGTQAITAMGPDLLLRWTGSAGVADVLAGFGVCAAIGLMCVLLAGMGGGDAKLIAALGALLGFEAVLHVLLNGLMFAAVFALCNAVLSGRVTSVLRYLAYALMTLIYSRQRFVAAAYPDRYIPFAVPLLLGLLVSPFFSFTSLLA